jgi:hypothetical protein
MQQETSYRGYVISHDGEVFSAETAEPNDPDGSDKADLSGTDFLRIYSKDISRLYTAIDELHGGLGADHTDNFSVPAWAMPWLIDGRTQIDIDAYLAALQAAPLASARSKPA